MNVSPTGPKTGYSHPRCYASSDENCSRKLSREHAISESLLKQGELNGTTKIAGLAWQARETFDIVGTKSLASKILCKRHNSALSPLDTMIAEFSVTLEKFDKAFLDNAKLPATEEQVYSGSALEKWMLKCLIGMSKSGNFARSIKPECIELLYGRIDWPVGWGLYWTAQPRSQVYHSPSLAIQTQFDPRTNVIVVITFEIRGIPFSLCIGKPDHPTAFGVYRPSALVFRGPNKERRLSLKWDDNEVREELYLDRFGAYDGPHPHWPEWARKS